MASELQSAGQPIKIWIGKNLHELIIRTRQQNVDPVQSEVLGELTLKTIGLWLAVYKAIESKDYAITRQAPELELGVVRTSLEPLVTVFNKTWDGLSVTVNSADDGNGAIQAVLAIDYAIDTMRQKMPQLFARQDALDHAKKVNEEIANASNTPPDLDEFIKDDPYQKAKQNASSAMLSNHSFRMFKRIALNVVQVQEFVQGGGEKYQKSAIEATQSWHKKNAQGYDDGALVYYPITGAIALKQGRYGLQASIVTAKGTVYLDATNKNDEETLDWQAFRNDFTGEEWAQLEQTSVYEANGCILVLKMSAINGDTQWKNYYHIYKPFSEKGDRHPGMASDLPSLS